MPDYPVPPLDLDIARALALGGAIAVIAGVWICSGFGAALIVTGLGLLFLAWCA